VIWIAGVVVVLATDPARASHVDGFTEPYRSVNVSTTETGIIRTIEVHEGDAVEAGQVLATLDSEVHAALLAIAEENMNAQGRLDASRAELELRSNRLEKLEDLRLKGFARQEEVERARADVAIAKAQVVSAREELLVRKLEYEKIKIQLERRTVRAPLAGVVTVVHKEPGEFVAPNAPELLKLVQLDWLLAVFSIPSHQALLLTAGQTVIVRLADGLRPLEGTIEFISPVTDAESGTVRVKVRMDNRSGLFRSGQRCSLQLPDSTRRASAATR
jgi:RND family efflux transporter MFP subunit